MSLMSVNPAAGRIAEIRAAIGAKPEVAQQSNDFSRRLDAALDVAQPRLDAALDVAKPRLDVAQPRLEAPIDLAAELTRSVGPDTPFAALFNEAGQRHGVSPALLASVAHVESGFDPNAVSPVGAGGLMQFMPATAVEMGVNAFDPASAVDGAARYLARDLARFGRVDLAVAAYNAGPGAVQAHGGVPPYAETQRYVEKVLNSMEAHR